MGGSLVFGDIHEGVVGRPPASVLSQLPCGEHLVPHALTVARFCLTTVPKASGDHGLKLPSLSLSCCFVIVMGS